ncbi:hypothetical protein LTR28_006236 [Elasticomyces elasticus]|nr:hypothetical protein LTR28_006236 [Elasticomyces elasticus]
MLLRPRLAVAHGSPNLSNTCSRCLRKIYGQQSPGRRSLSTSWNAKDAAVRAQGNWFEKKYFFANGFRHETRSFDRRRDGLQEETRSYTETETFKSTRSSKTTAEEYNFSYKSEHTSSIAQHVLPHRRRKRLKDASALAANTTATPSTDEPIEIPLPPDASATLSLHASTAPKSFRRTLATYLALSKPRLAFLIVLTTTASYSLYPVPALLSSTSTDAPTLSTLTLLFLTTGTFLTIASANTLNMLAEPAHDAKMSRTRNRPLVRKLVTKQAAAAFALATGVIGTAALYYGVNPTTAALGAGNIFLYAAVYTPLKRVHVVNTWVGAIVGAVPPLMGWCAAAGQCATTYRPFASSSSSSSGGSAAADASSRPGLWEEAQELLLGEGSAGGWLLAALLFAWQFPHFNALSWTIREEYRHAGYRMLCFVNPGMNARVALRYSLLMFPICLGLSYVGVTDRGFVITSTLVNAWMAREAVRFWRYEGARGSARGLFWASVWQLPIVLVLAMVHKKGLWEGLWRRVGGRGEEEEWEDGEG